jgi:hypothetical protein
MGARIDIKSLLSQKSYQGDTRFFRQLYGETGGRSYGCYYSYASHGSFLDELEAGPAAEQEDVSREGEPSLLQRMPDDLIQGIVPSDIFPER